MVGATLSEMPESDSVFSQMAKGNERARARVCVLVALRGVGVGMGQGHPFQESRHHNPVVLSGDELAFSALSAGVLCTHVVYTCHGLWVSWLHPPYPFCTLLTPPPQNLTPFTSDDVRNSLFCPLGGGPTRRHAHKFHCVLTFPHGGVSAPVFTSLTCLAASVRPSADSLGEGYTSSTNKPSWPPQEAPLQVK